MRARLELVSLSFLALTAGCLPLEVRPAAEPAATGAAEPVYLRVRYQGTPEVPDPVTEDQFLQAVRHVLPEATLVEWGEVPPEGRCGVDLVVSWSDSMEERATQAGDVSPAAQAIVYWERTYTLEAVVRSRWGAVTRLGSGSADGTMSFARTVPLGTPLSGADAFANARWLALRRCLTELRASWSEHRHDPPEPAAARMSEERREAIQEQLARRRRRIS